VPVVPAVAVVDQTGAGDSMTGTLCARLAAGDDLVEAVRRGAAAAALAVGALGGTGHLPTRDDTPAPSTSHPTTPLTNQGVS
jgi:2-dehydro-3-deoxygluconokinase